MNYIKQLQQRGEELQGEVDAAHDAARHLLDYAMSDKFMGPSGVGGPTYISKDDVILRVRVILGTLLSERNSDTR